MEHKTGSDATLDPQEDLADDETLVETSEVMPKHMARARWYNLTRPHRSSPQHTRTNLRPKVRQALRAVRSRKDVPNERARWHPRREHGKHKLSRCWLFPNPRFKPLIQGRNCSFVQSFRDRFSAREIPQS